MGLRSAAPLCVLLLTLPAGAGFYRWTDAAGREHFAQDLHQVPAEHRAEAEAAREGTDAQGAGAITYHESPRRRPTVGGRAEAEREAPAAQAPPAWSCSDLRRRVRKQERVIARHRASVESNQRWADDISKSVFTRRKYEALAEEEARWLERAETELAAFHEEQRRLGVPPGCLRS